MAEPVPPLDVPRREQQEQVHSLQEDKPGPVGEDSPVASPRQDQDNSKLWSDKAKYWIGCRVHPESPVRKKMGLETRLPVPQVSRFSQEVRLETGAAQAWAEMLPQIHGQWVQNWGWLGQLGPFSALRTLAAPQRKTYTEMAGGGMKYYQGKKFQRIKISTSKNEVIVSNSTSLV